MISVSLKSYQRISQKIYKDDQKITSAIAEKIENAIINLPVENSEAIKLHYIENIPRKEIAKKLGWSLSKVNTKLTRGISLLRLQCNPDLLENAKKIFERQVERIINEKMV